jgi:hypothetical protein
MEQQMNINLKTDVFEPVVTRIIERRDSLSNVKRFQRAGIEGWLKVEIVAALGNLVKSLQNKGPDLILKDGTKIELKAATDFNKSFFFEPIRKYGCACMFLGDGDKPEKLTNHGESDFEIVGFKVFSDGKNKWLLGLIKPKMSNR